MSELLERYMYSLDMDKIRKRKEEADKNSTFVKEQREVERVQKIKEAREMQIQNFNKFSKDVKDMLLSEALYSIYSPSLGELTESTKVLSENLVFDYIKENGGADMLILKSRGKSLALESLLNAVEDTYDAIMEKADKKDPKVDNCDMETFFDRIANDDDIENMSQAIRLRVANAEEEFLNNNISDKMAMKDIADDTASRISAAKDDGSIDQSLQNDIEQEAVMLSRAALDDIRHNRPRSVFEQLVRKLSDSVIKDSSLLESYSVNDHIDISKIVDTSRCMYGLLEAINSLQLEKVDSKYIQNMIN